MEFVKCKKGAPRFLAQLFRQHLAGEWDLLANDVYFHERERA